MRTIRSQIASDVVMIFLSLLVAPAFESQITEVVLALVRKGPERITG